MFLGLLWLTGFIAIGAAYYGYWHFRDPFHPSVLLGILLAWLYFFSPLLLYHLDIIQRYLPVELLPSVQFIFLIGVLSILLGLISVRAPRVRQEKFNWSFSPEQRRRIRLAGVVLGLLGLAAFYITVNGAGGVEELYSHPHGRSDYGTGYVRDAITFGVPGLLLILLSNSGKPLGMSGKVLIAMITGPIIFDSLLSASRGPVSAILMALGVGWYMFRHRRPRAVVLFVGGAALAFVVLFLAANRGAIYLGSKSAVRISAIEQFIVKDNPGQEYIFGAGGVITSRQTGHYQWGSLYIVELLVRPIPRFLWPTKYQDAAEVLGATPIGDMNETSVAAVAWVAPGGAATGIIADLWMQFWWLMIVPLFLVGRVLATCWKLAVSRGGLWTVVYILFLSHSLYLVQQALWAMLAIVLTMLGGTWIVWSTLVGSRTKTRDVMRSKPVEQSAYRRPLVARRP